jgi:hypothetical protein
MKTILKILDEVNVRFDGLDIATRRKLVTALEFELPYARHMPSFKLGRWNGKTSYCSIGGTTYINLIDKLLPIIQAAGYEVEIEDMRPVGPDFEFDLVDEDSYSHLTWPPGHPIAGQPIKIKEHQVAVINSYLENITGINIAPTGSGKAQPLYSKIKTPTGWTSMGDISIGDIVSTPDGAESSVTGIFPQGIKDIYRITFADGRTADCCKDHLWNIYNKHWKNKWKTISLEEIIRLKSTTTSSYYIPLVKTKTDAETSSLADPYMFGLLETEFIPEVYKCGSVQEREAVIAGLVDSDGYVCVNGKINISTWSERMANDIQEIIWSIGGIAKITSKLSAYIYKGKKKTGLRNYNISIRYPTPKNLSKLTMKKDILLKNHQYTDLRLQIEKIELIGSDLAQCIMIDHPAHLYITDNFVVTHNTLITAILSHKVEPYGRSIVIVPTKDLVTQTEEDYINMGLDVGVFFGDRKDYLKTHTICTWQSLESLAKRSKETDLDIDINAFFENVVCVMADECFHSDTLVLTTRGYLKIVDINIGDKIINYSEKNGTFKEDIVEAVYTNLTKSNHEKMYELNFDNGKIIKVTGNHKFLTDRGWIRADQLTEQHNIKMYI